QAGAVHGGIGQAHGQGCLHGYSSATHRVLDTGHGGLVGDPLMIVEHRLQARRRQPLFNLGAGAVDQDNADSQGVEQCDIVNDMGEVAVQHPVPRQGDDKGFAPVHIDIGGAIAEEFDIAHGCWSRGLTKSGEYNHFFQYCGPAAAGSPGARQLSTISALMRSMATGIWAVSRYSSGWWAWSMLPGPITTTSMPSCWRKGASVAKATVSGATPVRSEE